MVDIIGTNSVKCMEYDGHYFWTLQEGSTSTDIIIKKWYIENFVLKLKEILPFNHTSDHLFDVDTFSLEYYNTTLSSGVLKNDTSIYITDFIDYVDSGTVITIGPNNEGQFEDVTVTGTLSYGALGLDFFINYDYDIDTSVYFTTNLLLVNKYAYTTYEGGALYKVKLPQKEIIEVIVDTDFVSVFASCFYIDTDNKYILLSLGTNLRFVNLISLMADKTMTLDNIKTDQSTIIPIYALQVDGDTLYRLQRSATYFGGNNNFTTANYQVSPIRPFIDSITANAFPKILPANGMNVSEVTAIVNDQYAHPIRLKPVEFQDSDSVGFMTIQYTYTDLFGVATSYYKAGIIPDNVLIMVMATQYD